ncbi:hypothetical protein EIN_210650 [Entamoeba invadens IP1]|uniref:Uncharacterized protein n=1 Tax=Entamoeba invadens IP1 TaxID=370355 RepID=L7FND4_ENTIV|nr:hypothetical protein EIN_210650 [Entamoeba invadens IP1]ELP92970.1 hypothetical protein EIN_210650 [Entamoeba invadens IP1]|eukprot:XP_004259741.1 hypothetical protein EIN_210650 [Entamoeba invadens IP1]
MIVSLKEASRLLQEAGNVFTSEMIEYFTVPEVDRFLVTIQMETLPWVVPIQVIQAETDVIPAQRSQHITADPSMNSITDNENVPFDSKRTNPRSFEFDFKFRIFAQNE